MKIDLALKVANNSDDVYVGMCEDDDKVKVTIPVHEGGKPSSRIVFVERGDWLKMCMLFTIMAGEGSEKPT